MYPDPKKVKDIRYTFRLNDYEDAMLRELANTLGEQPATLIREILMTVVDAELAKLDRGIVSQTSLQRKPTTGRTESSKMSALKCWGASCLNI